MKVARARRQKHVGELGQREMRTRPLTAELLKRRGRRRAGQGTRVDLRTSAAGVLEG